jgi:hypothetical protein
MYGKLFPEFLKAYWVTKTEAGVKGHDPTDTCKLTALVTQKMCTFLVTNTNSSFCALAAEQLPPQNCTHEGSLSKENQEKAAHGIAQHLASSHSFLEMMTGMPMMTKGGALIQEGVDRSASLNCGAACCTACAVAAGGMWVGIMVATDGVAALGGGAFFEAAGDCCAAIAGPTCS